MAAGAVSSWLLDLAPTGLWDDYQRYISNVSAVNNSTEIELLVPEKRQAAVSLYSPLPLVLSTPAQLGLFTGLLLAFVIHARRDLTKERQWLEAAVTRSVAALWCLMMAAAALPAATVVLLLCAAYRAFVSAALSCTLGDDFAGLLEGSDAVWSVEDDTALAVINVLALVQVEDESVDGPRLLQQLRSLLQNKVESGLLPEKLLLLRRHSPLGYFYWQRRPRPLAAAAVIREHVRGLDGHPGGAADRLPWPSLKKRLSELANSNLPQQHAACWELLVGTKPLTPELEGHDLLTAMEEGFPEWCDGSGGGSGVPRLFPVFFRIHHSIGDGISLLGLLMDTIAGKQMATPTKTPPAGWCQQVAPQGIDGKQIIRDGCRATSIISKVPTLTTMPATTAPRDRSNSSPPAVLNTETEQLASSPPKSPSSKTDKEVAKWLLNRRNTFEKPVRKVAAPSEAKWAPPRPATPAVSRNESPAPHSRPTTPFHCFIDATGTVSFNNHRPIAVNSKKPILVGSAQNGVLTPQSRPASPISRPCSPIPPYISTSPISATPRKRVLNGQTPLRPYSPNGIRLHCYNGTDSFVTFPDDVCVSSSNLGERKSTTIYYYNPENGGTLTSKKEEQTEVRKEMSEVTNSRSSSVESLDSAKLLQINQPKRKPKPLGRSVSFDIADKSRYKQSLNKHEDFKHKTSNYETTNDEDLISVKRIEELKVPYVKIEEIPVDSSEINREDDDLEIPDDWRKPEQEAEYTEREDGIPIDGHVNQQDEDKKEVNERVFADESFLSEEAQLFDTLTEETTDARYEWLLRAVSRRYDTALRLSRGLCALLFAPAALLYQGLLHEAANRDGPLHAQQLCGRKVVSWLSEPQLLDTVREVRRRVVGARFSDVLLAAVSGALERHLGERAPRAATVVLPERLRPSSPAAGHRLDNRFSVALLALPVASAPRSATRRLHQVARLTTMLRQAPDYQVNYWMMRVVSAALPTVGLRAVLRSARSTAVLSNVRGPERPVSLAGHRVRDLVFWVPNRGTNGLGVSVLSYAGSLQLGLLMDESLTASPDDDSRLLAAIATELRHLDVVTTF